ncbi:hypothetical protein BDN72DRAFT_376319 [Pluteus cervinus]|uniref:Uncharacterized protein n=1 Tax=Pluteus cervinus TaxID=181527 RepID=A0ACD3ABH3_9AGAR|nr:hypothetical protein BDN72DRAFT_376319 [Pluteus cervinus]
MLLFPPGPGWSSFLSSSRSGSTVFRTFPYPYNSFPSYDTLICDIYTLLLHLNVIYFLCVVILTVWYPYL